MDLMRSLMFVPGHRQKMVDKAMGLPLDVALFDLEDGVPPAEKETARALLREVLGRSPGGPTRFVRVNAVNSDRLEGDLEAVVVPGLEGLLLPKVETADEVTHTSGRLAALEKRAGLAVGSTRLIPAIESARGLLHAHAVASADPRVAGVMFGAEDYGNDLGLPTTREGEARELLYARSSLVVACAAARVQSFDGVWPDIQDDDGLRRDAVQARRLGFSGKSLIHPGQIEVINDVFSPSEGEVDYARRVVEAFEAAQARGDGAIAFGGQLIDLPIVERALRVLQAHAALQAD